MLVRVSAERGASRRRTAVQWEGVPAMPRRPALNLAQLRHRLIIKAQMPPFLPAQSSASRLQYVVQPELHNIDDIYGYNIIS